MQPGSMTGPPPDAWLAGESYEPYIGRWSRLVARQFIAWVDAPGALNWLDIGCGTGALSGAILESAAPASVKGVDPSEAFVAYAKAHVRDRRASFEIGDAQALGFGSDEFEVAVSGLVLNFVTDPRAALQEMRRVVRSGGTAALYVWDYAGKMEMLRYFWSAAVALDPGVASLDEGKRFPICNPVELEALFNEAGFRHVASHAIDVSTPFRDFEDYWQPFLGGQGPAPTYLMSLSENHRRSLRRQVQASLPTSASGEIRLVARAWAVSAQVP